MNDNERRVGDAMRSAYLELAGTTEPAGHRVVLRVLADVADIERRQARQIKIDNRVGGPVAARPAWCNQVVRDYDERDEAAKQRRQEIDNGADYRRILGLPLITDDEIVLAELINAAFKAALPSEKTRERDWQLLKRIATGRGSERDIARELGVGKSVVSDAKSKQGRAASIWNALKRLMPEPAVPTRVWSEAA